MKREAEATGIFPVPATIGPPSKRAPKVFVEYDDDESSLCDLYDAPPGCKCGDADGAGVGCDCGMDPGCDCGVNVVLDALDKLRTPELLKIKEVRTAVRLLTKHLHGHSSSENV